MKEIISFIEQNHERYLEELFEFLRIPSISTDPNRKSDVARAAGFVAEQIRCIGAQRVEIVETAGNPIVYGEVGSDDTRPTVLVYGHYDVQPVDPLGEWDSPPFEPEVRNGELYARGATDDKGQMFIHFKSVEAYRRTNRPLPVNVKYLIEGEEEIGSENLDAFVKAQADRLQCDAVLVSDTALFERGVPSICCGLRGIAYFQVDLIGPQGDLHSGSFGGPVGNPAFVLARLLASLKDDNDRVTIPGFYDDVRELDDREEQEFASLPFDLEAFKSGLGVRALSGEKGFTPLEQLWARPTLEVNGLLSGFTGEGAKTVIPSRAMAKISARLVPDQDYRRIQELVVEYLETIAPETVEIKVTTIHGGQPWVAPLDHPALVAASKAVEKGFGKRPVLQREGGSIPVVATFDELLGVPTVLMGIGLPDENAHAPNEHLNLQNFYCGLKSAACFLDEFGRRCSD